MGAGIVEFDREAVKAGLAEGTILLVDVREPHERAAGHIPGSVGMALSAFDPGALAEAEGRLVVFACNSGVRTLKAIAMARAAGFDLNAHYPGSFRDWVMAGEPVAVDEA